MRLCTRLSLLLYTASNKKLGGAWECMSNSYLYTGNTIIDLVHVIVSIRTLLAPRLMGFNTYTFNHGTLSTRYFSSVIMDTIV